MGCRQGKIVAMDVKQGEPMGRIVVPEAPAPVDPRLPVNARELFKLQKSWKAIKRNMEATGIELFVEFFRTHGQMKALFKSFKYIDIDDQLRENENLAKHAGLVMSVFDRVITKFDDYDAATGEIRKIGKFHRNFEGFMPELFLQMQEPMHQALKITLQDRYTDQMKEIYTKVVLFILEGLAQSLVDPNL